MVMSFESDMDTKDMMEVDKAGTLQVAHTWMKDKSVDKPFHLGPDDSMEDSHSLNFADILFVVVSLGDGTNTDLPKGVQDTGNAPQLGSATHADKLSMGICTLRQIDTGTYQDTHSP
jgi:hypothetical protein